MKKTFLLITFLFTFAFVAAAQRVQVEQAPTQKNISLNPSQWWDTNHIQPRTRIYAVKFLANSPVDVYLIDARYYNAFLKKEDFPFLYSSGRVKEGYFSLRLPKGNYKLIVSNRFSDYISSAINVQEQDGY